MNLADFKALANKNGLVPMTIIRPFAPWKLGDVAGFQPARALELFNDKDAVPPGHKMPKEGARSGPRTTAKGNVTRQQMDRVNEETLTTTDGVIQIPVTWVDSHPLQKIKLAKQIAGDAYDLPHGMRASDYANSIIEAELKRRMGSE